ncbi:MAG: SUMF1/EgtB/PvdO family nonheme iron enzyme, partial [Acidobacteria bacterium]|nr:SUMF1/EgtB/PvdO family nonheme iron enzyme [Acidobacteriota bacterium]
MCSDHHLAVRRGRAASAALLLVTTAAYLQGQPAPAAAPAPAYTETIPGTTVTFEMVAIPGGTFSLGSPETEPGRDPDEGPPVQVVVAPFWMARTEVTWDEYDQFAFVGNTGVRTGDQQAGDSDAVSRPSRAYGDEAKGFGKGRQPAVAMTHHAAMEYCRWLSQQTGKAYRLPTEAEWEYAARAGAAVAQPVPLDAEAWHAGNAGGKPHPVATRAANAFGLHDMLGNVAEWTLDGYAPGRYAEFGGSATPSRQPVALPTERRYPNAARGGAYDVP